MVTVLIDQAGEAGLSARWCHRRTRSARSPRGSRAVSVNIVSGGCGVALAAATQTARSWILARISLELLAPPRGSPLLAPR